MTNMYLKYPKHNFQFNSIKYFLYKEIIKFFNTEDDEVYTHLVLVSMVNVHFSR